MTKDKYIYISIYLHNKGYIPAGVITFNEDIGYSGFSYFPNYMEHNYPPLNPSTLNYRDGNQRHFLVPPSNNQMLDRTFWEMIPDKNDWGSQVLVSRFPEYSQMNNAQKLYFLGNRTVGGLSSYVHEKAKEESITGIDWLDKIRSESIDFYTKNIEKISYIKAINPLTSYGGMRPKCMFEDENGFFWIAKFNLPNDPYDMAKAEKITMDMAKDAGLKVPDTKVLCLPSGENVFLSKRFDREGEERFHSLSLFALSPGNEIQKRNQFSPGNPASFIATIMRRYSDFQTEDTVNIVTKLLLDIGVNNTDNHLRNLRIILNKEMKWELSPIFDVIFNPYSQPHVYNPAGLPLSEMYLENPQLIEEMAKELSVSEEIIFNQLNRVKPVIDNWEKYCEQQELTEEDKLKIGNAISLGSKRKEYRIEHSINLQNKIQAPKLKPKNSF